jgi:tRNA/rRNA methyltransferase
VRGDPSNIQIVLVEPHTSANIGAVCRAMDNMGLSMLAIVGNKIYDSTIIRNLSVHSFKIYENSKRYPHLTAAVSDSVFIAGATRRMGKKRKLISVFPEELAEKIHHIKEGKISVVFGRESNGLTVEELSECNIAVTIPSSLKSPSLNLSQAVQIIIYAIYRADYSGIGYSPVNNRRMTVVIETLTDSLEKIDFFKLNEKNELKQFFSDIFSRAAISEQESLRIEKTFRKIADIKNHKNKS